MKGRDSKMKIRCDWVGEDSLMIDYHDEEWGVAVHDDKRLFEFLILEGAQAGLSWSTVLKKRENYRKAFDFFDVEKVRGYDNRKIESLLADRGIIRNRLKITAAIQNAKAFTAIQEEFGSFDKYIWSFVGGKIIKNAYEQLNDIPAKIGVSEEMSRDLLKRGFKFVGPTICYAFMQAVGMVNDHQVKCLRYREV